MIVFKNVLLDLVWINFTIVISLLPGILVGAPISEDLLLLQVKFTVVVLLVSITVSSLTRSLYLTNPGRFRKKLNGWFYSLFISFLIVLVGSIVVGGFHLLISYNSFSLTDYLFVSLKVFAVAVFLSRFYVRAVFNS